MNAFAFSTEDCVQSFLVHYPDLGHIMRGLGIDPIADGLHTLASRCRIVGRDACDALRRLALAAVKTRSPETEDWSSTSLAELANHIDTSHHAYQLGEVPRLGCLVDMLADRRTDVRTAYLRSRWATFARAIMEHLRYEVETVLPACQEIERAMKNDCPPSPTTLELRLRDLMENHAACAVDLDAIIVACDELPTAAHDEDIRQTLRAGLGALRADLRIHDQEEEDILLPAALYLQEVLVRKHRNRCLQEDPR